MRVYPTLEIMNGQCVSLTRGRIDEPVIWHVDPIETARGFVQAGAQWMHLTDMDALSGRGNNDDLIEELIRSVGIGVQLGGGFRSRERVEHWIDRGAARIVIGSMASYEPDFVKELAKYHPDQIVLALDVFQGQVMTDGWREVSALSPKTLLDAFADAPLAGVIITDIDADIEDSDGSVAVISGLAAQTRHPVIARGTVSRVDDVATLRYVPNIAGTLIGRALMSRDVDLAEALAVARPAAGEAVAEFL